MVNLVTVPGRELMKVGNYELSTGPFEVTPQRIQDTIKAHEAAVLRKPVVRLGHNDPRFSGDPAVGWVDNVRASEDGNTLYGDLVGVPEWLADIMPSAYPSLSIEGMYGYTAPDGETHDFVLTGLALLGATAPGIETLQSVQDVAKLYGVEDAVAAQVGEIGGTPVSFTVEAAQKFDEAPDGDSGKGSDKTPYGNVDYADPGYQSDGVKRYPLDTAEHVRAAWSYIGQHKNAAEYSAQQLVHIKKRIQQAAKKFGVHIQASEATEEKGSVMALPEKLAEALGVDASADEAAITAAWEKYAADAETERAQLVAASAPPEGVVQVEASALDKLKADAEAGRVARERQIAEDDERVVMAAIKDGKIAPARKDHWLESLKADREGSKQVLASLAAGLIPVAELGHSQPGDESKEVDKGLETVHDRVMASLGMNSSKGVN